MKQEGGVRLTHVNFASAMDACFATLNRGRGVMGRGRIVLAGSYITWHGSSFGFGCEIVSVYCLRK